ncbi:MAG: amidohydrolase [Chloroflexota bacterium]|nr:amidohydrolase [Chloroflexota bacterium]
MEFADLVISGATVETMTGRPTRANAVAVRAGRIVAVGTRRDVQTLAGPATRSIALDGETLLPGFQDAHVHPIHGGLSAALCDLHDLDDARAYPDRIAAYAAAHPDREWISGSGWAMSAFPGGNPGRSALDAIVPDRPVFLASRDGHSAWVNSRALQLAGITAATPDPIDGRIERDAKGEPAGTLHEGAANLVEVLIPTPTAGDLDAALAEAQRYLHSLGITAWQDAWNRAAELAAYRRAVAEERLTMRVVAAQLWDNGRGPEQIADLIRERDTPVAAPPDRFRADSVKFFVDGIIENGTALLTEPYLGPDGNVTENRGIPMIPPDELRAAVSELDRLGFQCHFHAIGDGGVRLALDAIEGAVAANGRTDGRHHIAHIELIQPADIPRFAAIGATANMQPLWASHDNQMRDLRIPVLGPLRTAWQYPFGGLLRSGARLAGGSDWTVSSPNPLLEMEVAVTRVDPDARHNPPFLPDERLPLDAALAAFTIGSAYVNHLDHLTGTLEAGKAADMVVLDRNLRASDAGPIGDARVALTLAEGTEVYSG